MLLQTCGFLLHVNSTEIYAVSTKSKSGVFVSRQHAMPAERDIVLPVLPVCLSICPKFKK